MSNQLASRCGIYCGGCQYREKMKCPGCQAAGGSVFWGKCELAKCSIDKGLEGCGQCENLPCEQLKAFSYDEVQGDNGQRIRNLQAWNEEGFDKWLQKNSAKE